MNKHLYNELILEAVNLEDRAKRLREAAEVLSEGTTTDAVEIVQQRVNVARIRGLEKAREVKAEKSGARKQALDAALRKIFVDNSRYTIAQTIQLLRSHGVVQKMYRDRRSFSNCVYHSLRELAKAGLVAPINVGTKEYVWAAGNVVPAVSVGEPESLLNI